MPLISTTFPNIYVGGIFFFRCSYCWKFPFLPSNDEYLLHSVFAGSAVNHKRSAVVTLMLFKRTIATHVQQSYAYVFWSLNSGICRIVLKLEGLVQKSPKINFLRHLVESETNTFRHNDDLCCRIVKYIIIHSDS